MHAYVIPKGMTLQVIGSQRVWAAPLDQRAGGVIQNYV